MPEEHKRGALVYDQNFYRGAGLVDGEGEVTVKDT